MPTYRTVTALVRNLNQHLEACRPWPDPVLPADDPSGPLIGYVCPCGHLVESPLRIGSDEYLKPFLQTAEGRQALPTFLLTPNKVEAPRPEDEALTEQEEGAIEAFARRFPRFPNVGWEKEASE
jgi:hypothetical protein